MSETDSMFPALEGAMAAAPKAAVPAAAGRARIKPVDRNQLMMRPVDVERLIEEDHPARAIWDFVGKLDLSSYEKPIEAVGGGGWPAGVGSALADQFVDLRLQPRGWLGTGNQPAPAV